MRLSIAALVLGAGAACVLPGHVSAQGSCEDYAKIALKQQQDNERLKCGYKSDGWSADLRSHTGWCAGVSPDIWRKAIQTRHKELEACRKR